MDDTLEGVAEHLHDLVQAVEERVGRGHGAEAALGVESLSDDLVEGLWWARSAPVHSPTAAEM